MMPVLIGNLLFLALNIGMAWHHSRLIRQNKPILHGLWAWGYLTAVIMFAIFYGHWWLPVLIFLRALLFSPALSLFRGLPINYISRATGSIIDKLEYRVFGGHWYTRMGVYLFLLIVFEIILIIAE